LESRDCWSISETPIEPELENQLATFKAPPDIVIDEDMPAALNETTQESDDELLEAMDRSTSASQNLGGDSNDNKQADNE